MLADARSAQLEDRKMTRDTPNTHHQKLVNKYLLLALFGARLDITSKSCKRLESGALFIKARFRKTV